MCAQVNKAIFEKTISIRTGDIRFDSLLHQFARQTGVEFSFSANRVGADNLVRNTRPRQTLAGWLQVLEQSLGIRYKVVGNHIILYEAVKVKPAQSTPKASHSKRLTPDHDNQPRLRIQIDSGFSEAAASLPVDESVATTSNAALSAMPGSEALPASPATPRSASMPTAPATSGSASTPATQARPATTPAAAPQSATPAPTTKAARPAALWAPRYDPVKMEGLEAVQLFAGWSRNGSGDMSGVAFASTYSNYLSPRFSLNLDLRGLINWSKFSILQQHPITTQWMDNSVRFTTASAQLGVLAGWSLVQVARSELKVSLGPFGRFQSASNGDDGYGLYSPSVTGQPTYLIGYDNHTSQNKFSVGYLLSLQYQFVLRNDLCIGLAGVFQNDTNGDVIPQAGITFGKRF